MSTNPFDPHLAGKKLAAIAKVEDCTVEEAFDIVMDLYVAIQVGVWDRGYHLGVIDSDGRVCGVVTTKSEIDPNFDIDLD